jgi:serine O-acetyltransferase
MEITAQNLNIIIKKLFNNYSFFNIYGVICDNKHILSIFLSDYNRYFYDSYIDYEKTFSRIELIGILCYRMAHWFYENNDEASATQYSNLGRLISGFEIYYTAEIGTGLKINHGLGTVIGTRCKIGKNALLHQNVTLGDRNGGRPTLLDNVTLYAGAKVLGGITLGNNSVVAANSVCLMDIPDNEVCVGIPGKIKVK